MKDAVDVLNERIAELEAKLEHAGNVASKTTDTILKQNDWIDKLQAENEALKVELEPCRQYQKDGESLAECLERNRRDAGRAIRLYGEMKADAERLQFIEHEQLTIRWAKKGVGVHKPLTSYPIDLHKTLQEAIDAAREGE